MKSNDVQLDCIGFLVDSNETIDETCMSIQTAQSVSTISSLEIGCNTLVDILLVSKSLTDLCLNLKHMTSLEITTYCNKSSILLINIHTNLQCSKNWSLGTQ